MENRGISITEQRPSAVSFAVSRWIHAEVPVFLPKTPNRASYAQRLPEFLGTPCHASGPVGPPRSDTLPTLGLGAQGLTLSLFSRTSHLTKMKVALNSQFNNKKASVYLDKLFDGHYVMLTEIVTGS